MPHLPPSPPLAPDLAAAVVSSLPDAAVFVVDHDLRLLSAGGQVLARHGWSPGGVRGRALAELVPAATFERLAHGYRTALAGGEHETQARSLDGTAVYRTQFSPVRDAAGTIVAAMAVARDVTATVEAVQAFEAAFADAPIGMALVGLDGRWLRVNRALCTLLGATSDELLAKTFQEITHPDDLDADLAYIERLVAGEIAHYAMEKRYYTAGRELIWVQLSVSLVRDADGAPAYFVSQIQDVTERKRLEEHLRRLADHDPLTGLFNRRRFAEELERQVARCRRYAEQAALLVIDLDRFKEVNDTLGHKAGDDLLVGVARVMRGRTRSTDIVARLGGDEFAILLTGVTPDEAAQVADMLNAAIRGTGIEAGGRRLRATGSIGVAFLSERTNSDEEALIEADLAMYQAKAAGRDRASTSVGPPPGRIRVAHCDDSGSYRRLVDVMLRGEPDLEVVAGYDSHADALAGAERSECDVLLLDAVVPSGRPAVVDELRSRDPDLRIVVLSGHERETTPLGTQGDAYVRKTASFDELATEIRRVAQR